MADPRVSPTTTPSPPVAPVQPVHTTTHGRERIDEYAWMRDRSDPEVIRYLEEENAYTALMTAETDALQQRLYDEMLARIKETDTSAPVPLDDHWYYRRTEEQKPYRIHCRRVGRIDAQEEVLLDENELADGQEFFQLGVFAVSPDHRLLAYTEDTSGAERYTLRVKDLETGVLLPDRIEDVSYSVAWANDSRTFFYTVLDAAHRPYEVRRHRMGTDPAADTVVFHEPDEAFFVSVTRTRSRALVLIEAESKTTSEAWFLPADSPETPPRIVAPREEGVEYGVEHHDLRLFIVTNHEATNFRLVSAPLAHPDRTHWTDVVPPDPNVKIDAVDAFRDHLAVWIREGGYAGIRILDLLTDQWHTIQFPEAAHAVGPEGNLEFDTTTLRFRYTSLITPPSVYDYDMRTRTRDLKKQIEVLGGYDPDAYRSERVVATAPDGREVPISLVYKGDLVRDGRRPTLLTGYGSYGISLDPTFASTRLSLLDRGCIFAIAHVRGGGEMGRPWYEDGKLLNKKNTFADFVAAADHLVTHQYTSPRWLAIRGGSAGGLLMGAVMNMRPDLFHAVVAQVPFVDVLNTMLDPSLPLTVTEYDEWGNPEQREYFEYIASYAPYENVHDGPYPHLLVTAGLNDPRVQYWEPAKWTARLRARKDDDRLLLLKTHLGAGHRGASGRYGELEDTAFWTAFVLHVLGADAADDVDDRTE